MREYNPILHPNTKNEQEFTKELTMAQAEATKDYSSDPKIKREKPIASH